MFFWRQVCNNLGHCHCEVGYAPPTCESPGYGGSIDSGPASNEYGEWQMFLVWIFIRELGL